MKSGILYGIGLGIFEIIVFSLSWLIFGIFPVWIVVKLSAWLRVDEGLGMAIGCIGLPLLSILIFGFWIDNKNKKSENVNGR